MTPVYYAVVAIVLYFGSDWILGQLEESRGSQFEHRSTVFFAIILVLAVGSFKILEYLTTP